MIDPTAPAHPYEHKFGDGTATRGTGIPIRLELASRYLAGMASSAIHLNESFEERAEWALAQADALLQAYNDTTP